MQSDCSSGWGGPSSLFNMDYTESVPGTKPMRTSSSTPKTTTPNFLSIVSAAIPLHAIKTANGSTTPVLIPSNSTELEQFMDELDAGRKQYALIPTRSRNHDSFVHIPARRSDMCPDLRGEFENRPTSKLTLQASVGLPFDSVVMSEESHCKILGNYGEFATIRTRAAYRGPRPPDAGVRDARRGVRVGFPIGLRSLPSMVIIHVRQPNGANS
jgi:hypothetical protein